MIKAAFLSIIIIACLIQATLLDYFSVFGVKPDLLLACMVMAVLSFEFKWAFFFGVSAGLLKDAMGLSAFGINTFLFSLWAYLIINLSRKIVIENYFLPSLLIFIITFVNDITVRAMFFSFSGLNVPAGIFFRITFLESAYTALVFPLLFRAVKYQLSAVRSYRSRFLKNADKDY